MSNSCGAAARILRLLSSTPGTSSAAMQWSPIHASVLSSISCLGTAPRRGLPRRAIAAAEPDEQVRRIFQIAALERGLREVDLVHHVLPGHRILELLEPGRDAMEHHLSLRLRNDPARLASFQVEVDAFRPMA